MAQGPWDTGTWDAALWDSLPVTGNAGTGGVGTLGLSISIALGGVEATGSAGTVTPYIPPIFIDDTHDGDYKGKRFAEEREKKEKRKKELIDLYERVVEGRPEVAAQIVEPYVKTKARGQESAPLVKQVDFDKLMRDIAKVEALYAEHIEMDDEEVLALL